jgi:hypothetical protein
MWLYFLVTNSKTIRPISTKIHQYIFQDPLSVGVPFCHQPCYRAKAPIVFECNAYVPFFSRHGWRFSQYFFTKIYLIFPRVPQFRCFFLICWMKSSSIKLPLLIFTNKKVQNCRNFCKAFLVMLTIFIFIKINI